MIAEEAAAKYEELQRSGKYVAVMITHLPDGGVELTGITREELYKLPEERDPQVDIITTDWLVVRSADIPIRVLRDDTTYPVTGPRGRTMEPWQQRQKKHKGVR